MSSIRIGLGFARCFDIWERNGGAFSMFLGLGLGCEDELSGMSLSEGWESWDKSGVELSGPAN